MNNVKLEGRDYTGLEETESGIRFNVRTTMIPEILSAYDTYYQKGKITLDDTTYDYALIIFGSHAELLDTWIVDLIVPAKLEQRLGNKH